jgi:hypothetical protein
MANMTGMGKRGLCMNLGNCSNANQQKVLDIGIGEDFVCPECHKSLIVHNPRTGPSGAVLALGGGVLVAVLAGAGWWLYARNSAAPDPEPPAPVTVPAAAAVVPAAPPPPVVATPAPADATSDRLPPCGSNDDARRRLKLCD